MQSKVIEEETKLEELKTEAEFLQKQKESDLTAKLQLQIEIEKFAAKLKIYKDYNENLIEDFLDLPSCNDVDNNGYVHEYFNLHKKSESEIEVQNMKQIRLPILKLTTSQRLVIIHLLLCYVRGSSRKQD